MRLAVTIIRMLFNFFAAFTPSYLSALFQQETGICFKTYVDNLRFHYAENLLKTSDSNIAEVCTLSGFCDYANFSRRFRQIYGVTPEEYRQAQ